jgi:hypothetical protein
MFKNSKNAGVFLFVLCSNKEQQKDCVVRNLNLKTRKIFQTMTKSQSFAIYKLG